MNTFLFALGWLMVGAATGAWWSKRKAIASAVATATAAASARSEARAGHQLVVMPGAQYDGLRSHGQVDTADDWETALESSSVGALGAKPSVVFDPMLGEWVLGEKVRG